MTTDTPALYVSIEPSDPTAAEADWRAYLRHSREDAEYHSPYVLSFEEYMALPDAPILVL